MDKMPLVSVIVPTYNGSKYIKATLDSLLAQSYSNLEIIVIDDGSKDNTKDIVSAIDDGRIKLYDNGGKNYGLAYTSNHALELTTGEYIAHADHDDLSIKSRIKTQLDFLLANPDISGVSTRVKHVDGSVMAPTYDDDSPAQVDIDANIVSCEALWGGVISNPTIMYRRSAIEGIAECFDPRLKVSADMDFFEKMLERGARWVVIKNKLLEYRRHPGNTSRTLTKLKIVEKHEVLKRSMKRFMPEASEQELSLHVKIACRLDVLSKSDMSNAQNWFRKLIAHNSEIQYFDSGAWLSVLAVNWRYACALGNTTSPFKGLAMYRTFPEFAPYIKTKKYFYEWQKRFFRALSWIVEGKK